MALAFKVVTKISESMNCNIFSVPHSLMFTLVSSDCFIITIIAAHTSLTELSQIISDVSLNITEPRYTEYYHHLQLDKDKIIHS